MTRLPDWALMATALLGLALLGAGIKCGVDEVRKVNTARPCSEFGETYQQYIPARCLSYFMSKDSGAE